MYLIDCHCKAVYVFTTYIYRIILKERKKKKRDLPIARSYSFCTSGKTARVTDSMHIHARH